jgi:hypothetical protein
LFDMWPSSFIYKKVRHMQDLLSQTSSRWPDPWREKIELVI